MKYCLAWLMFLPNLAPAADPLPLPKAEVPAKVEESVLLPGQAVRLKIRQILPKDGLSPGERLLNSLPAIQPGDRFLAEVIEKGSPGAPPALVGGTIKRIDPPGHFRKHGKMEIELSQLVSSENNEISPFRIHMEDNRFTTRMRRNMLNSLFILEGAGIGASIGTQYTQGNIGIIGIGAGAGLIIGLGYAGIQKGSEASLDPGDVFEIQVGGLHYKPVAQTTETLVYPALNPSKRKPQP
ncbi:MAG: hypothetical protein EXR99_00330 [Gemmataceae bacterium]|nr:hypothetical protein [Gemmataceae bacterium]